MKANKTWLAWALSVGLIAYLIGAAATGRSVVDAGQTVRAYASGTGLHVDALQAGLTGPRVADVEVAFSASNVDSTGFGAVSRQNENEVLVQPNPADHDPATPFVGKNASGRGAGLELGLADDVATDPGSVLPLTRSGATAPPDTNESQEAGLEDALAPIAYVGLLHSDAIAQWQTSTCLTTAQSPISYGRGYAADVQLVDAGAGNPDGTFESPLVQTDVSDPDRNAIQTSSFTYAVPNGTGRFGLVSEVRQTYAPIQIGGTLVIELLGEWFVKTTVDGINPATIEYGVTDPVTGDPVDPGASVIRVSTDGGATFTTVLSLQDVMDGGIVLDLAPLPIQIALGEDVRAISAPNAIPDPDSSPTLTATRGAGAVDVVRIDLLDDPLTFGSVADLRIGHFESDLEVPAGGFSCPAPTTTTAGPTTTTTAGPTTTTTAGPTTTTTTAPATTTTTAPGVTTTTTAGPTTTTSPVTTTTTTTPQARPATPIRVQPRTVG